jgi:amino acid adenylation domain-containing protein
MREILRVPEQLPAEQKLIRAKCFHPSGTFIEFTRDEVEQSIPERFEKMARLYPDKLAVKTKTEELSYDALNRAANRLARAILERCGGGNQPVALLLDHDAAMIAAILGVLKAGKIYVPLDPSHPRPRITSKLEDLPASLIVTNNRNLSLANESARGGITLVNVDQLDAGLPAGNPGLSITPDSLAYILYTSGSTGQPKGVAQNHRNVLHDCMSYTNNLHICAADRVGLLASCSVGASVHYLYGALLNGAALCPFDIREKGLTRLAAWLIEEKITFFQLSANVFGYFADALTGAEEFSDLRLIALGSARVTGKDVELYKKYFPPACVLLNRLSTTESNTIRWHFVDKTTPIDGETLPVGYEVADKEILLLDEAGAEVGPGEIGEIAVRSRHLAPGYWRRPDLTRAAFIEDPNAEGKRTYRTGDLGRMQPNGCLAHLGRKDFRLKIRGFTVEAAEIERALLGHPNVKETVVVGKEDATGDLRLAAYVVADVERTPTIAELRSLVKAKLPDHMVPSAFIMLDALPLTPGGKVDRQALPLLEAARPQLDNIFVAPTTPLEIKLAKIWAEVLGIDRVGVQDDFFELGGHSLLATRVISRIRDAFQVELSLRCFFETPTVAALGDTIANLRRIDQERISPIQPISRDGKIPPSFAQQRLWFLSLLEPHILYNHSRVLRVRGVLDVEALRRTLDAVVARHEALRTTFRSLDGNSIDENLIQVVGEARSVDLPVIDLSRRPPEKRGTEFQRLLTEISRRPFGLSQDLMLRAALLRLDENDHVLILVTHDIACDGWSEGILYQEISAIYKNLGDASTLPGLPLQYADFTFWQRQRMQGEVLDEQLTFWKKQLKGAPPWLELPTDRPRPVIQAYQGSQRSMALSKEVTQGLKLLSRRHGVTLFMTLLAAFQILLHRYTGQKDIVVGSPIANRTRLEIERLIGCFVNTLALRADFSDNPGFLELLQQVREVCLTAYAHQELPFEKLVEELQPERNLGRNPLFEAMFHLRNAPKSALDLPGAEVEPMEFHIGIVKFDLTLSMVDEGENLTGIWEYSTELFDAATIDRLSAHFQRLLESILANPGRKVSALPLLTDAERRQSSIEWNDTKRKYPHNRCVHELFEAQVERTPDATAVVFEDGRLTYRELNQNANQLAHDLQNLGVGPEAPVGLCAERSAEMLVGLLAIFKAGGAYVPLDPAYPKERLAFMLEDARVSVLLAQRQTLDRLPEHNAQVAYLDKVSEKSAQENGSNPVAKATEQNAAYVIYTSGTTGDPKGVMIEHRSLVNYLCWFNESSPAKKSPGFPAITKPTFDAALKQWLAPLLSGGEVWIPSDEAVSQPGALLKTLAARAATGLNCVPSLWKAQLDALDSDREFPPPKSLSFLLLGGEPVNKQLVDRTFAAFPAVEIWNLYGPTEATANAAAGRIFPDGAVTIGRPVANTQIYLLDSHLEPVPVGMPGELHIGGAGLARGYLNSPDLTAEKFIPNPFGGAPGARLYKTGDMARYLPDGTIEFLGRIDNQVKIRGFRVELGEIEAALSRHTGVREAVALAREDTPGEKRLVAYIVSTGSPVPGTSDLREFLKAKLPDYMVPSSFVFLESLPLTPNGKVNRRALPAPDASRPELENLFVAPRSSIEETLIKIYSQVLGLDRVGVHDNFFDLGGHSLLATQVVSRVRESYRVELSLWSFFEAPTVAELAAVIQKLIDGGAGSPAPKIARVSRES